MPMTLAEKILARKSGRESVSPGEIVWCDVDLAMVHDSSGPRRLQPMLERLGASIWDPSKVVIATDHGFIFGAQMGGRWRLGHNIRLHLLGEDNVGTFYVGQYRGLAIVEMDRETAVAAIVDAEGSPGMPFEARKAQAVVTRSYLAGAHNRHARVTDLCERPR